LTLTLTLTLTLIPILASCVVMGAHSGISSLFIPYHFDTFLKSSAF